MPDEWVDDEEVYAPQPIPAMPWSWPSFAFSVSGLVKGTIFQLGSFVEDVQRQFASMHNLKIQNDDKREFASDVMAGLAALPKE